MKNENVEIVVTDVKINIVQHIPVTNKFHKISTDVCPVTESDHALAHHPGSHVVFTSLITISLDNVMQRVSLSLCSKVGLLIRT